MITACVDANVYISGIAFGGKPLRVLEHALNRRFHLVTGPNILQEVRRNLLGKLGLNRKRVDRFMCAQANADSMRCGSNVVSTGDSKYDVRAICGAPDDEEHRVETRTERNITAPPCPDKSSNRSAKVVESAAEVQVDVWTYDFGPKQFLQYITFENGNIVSVKHGDYGHKKAEKN